MVYTECMPRWHVSCGTSRVMIKQCCKYTTAVDIQNVPYLGVLHHHCNLLKWVIQSELHATRLQRASLEAENSSVYLFFYRNLLYSSHVWFFSMYDFLVMLFHKPQATEAACQCAWLSDSCTAHAALYSEKILTTLYMRLVYLSWKGELGICYLLVNF